MSAGTYSLSVTDANNCVQTATATVNQPTAVSGTPTITNVLCNSGNTGAIAANLSGGTGTLTYNWSNGATTSSISSLTVGNYILTVTDGNSCTSSFNYTVSSTPSFSNNATIQQVSCNGASNGSITTVLQNGAQPFSFNWSNGSASNSISNLGAGNYNLTITDNNSCTASYSYIISEPTALNTTSIIQNNNCSDQQNGSIALTVSGGTPTYTFNWSNGGNSSVLSSLAGGSYSVTISDMNNCTFVNTYTISTPLPLSGTLSSIAATCFATQTGSVSSNVVGGTSPYSFMWSNNSSQPNLSNVSAGNYTVTITDANGCSSVSSASVTQPANINDQDAITHVDCNEASNGSIYTNPTGGTSPFQWNWSNGSTMPTINNISGGNYSVTITDYNNCSAVFTYNVSEPSAISANTNTTDAINGQNGSVQFIISGGIGPYTISNNGSAVSNPAIGLTPGLYTFVVTDANGCSQSVNVTIGNTDGLMDESSPSVSLKPIPFQNDLVLEANEFLKVRITDVNGKVVFEKNEFFNSLKIETSTWPKGVYFVILSGKTQYFKTEKIVKN